MASSGYKGDKEMCLWLSEIFIIKENKEWIADKKHQSLPWEFIVLEGEMFYPYLKGRVLEVFIECLW